MYEQYCSLWHWNRGDNEMQGIKFGKEEARKTMFIDVRNMEKPIHSTKTLRTDEPRQ